MKKTWEGCPGFSSAQQGHVPGAVTSACEFEKGRIISYSLCFYQSLLQEEFRAYRERMAYSGKGIIVKVEHLGEDK